LQKYINILNVKKEQEYFHNHFYNLHFLNFIAINFIFTECYEITVELAIYVTILAGNIFRKFLFSFLKKILIFAHFNMVDVAQLVRVADCGSVGRGFKSHLPPCEKPDLAEEPVFFFKSCVTGHLTKKILIDVICVSLNSLYPNLYILIFCRKKRTKTSADKIINSQNK
jgi:hypothetical protein